MTESPSAVPPSTHRCPRCATDFVAASGLAQCPRCLLALASAPAGAATGPALPPIAELQPLFPGYELQTLLGRGGMGAVYRARHLKLDRLVAIKILLPDLVQDPAFAERFEREAKALARLTHPGIVGVHDFGHSGSFFFLVMEYVDGANLRDLLAQGQLGPRDVLGWVPQLCDALQYAHDHRVVHRDVKPENILIDTEGRVRIADFGLAKLVGQDARTGLTQTRQALGTPHYMAPEQVHAANQVDHRADLYSLGVVLYEMLTGELPIGRFQPPSAKAPGVRGLDPVVMKSLENDPAQRYQAAVDVKRDVQSVAADPANPPPAPAAASPAPAAAPAALPPTATASPVPQRAWLGTGLVLLANCLPWLHLQGLPSGPTFMFPQFGEGGIGWASSIGNFPIWLTVVAAVVAGGATVLRARGKEVSAWLPPIATAAGFGYCIFAAWACAATSGVGAGIGLVLGLVTFVVWTIFEFLHVFFPPAGRDTPK